MMLNPSPEATSIEDMLNEVRVLLAPARAFVAHEHYCHDGKSCQHPAHNADHRPCAHGRALAIVNAQHGSWIER